MNDDIRFILEQALLAPSGDNGQPWRWVVRGLVLELWNAPSGGLVAGLYGEGLPGHLAFGAAIENAALAATTRGYRTDVAYLPDPSQPLLIAVLTLVKDASVSPDPLAKDIANRVTNREPYRRTPLAAGERARVLAAGATDQDLWEAKFIDDPSSIAKLSAISALNDELIFSVKDLHDYIFSHISWTRREDERRRAGFYFPVLAAPPFSRGAMQLLRHWWLMRIGIFFGVHRLIALEQAFVYRHTGAYGIVIVHGSTPVEWLRVGRVVERLWIAANAAGLNLHPINGTLYFASNADTKEGVQVFSPARRERLKQARAEAAHLFSVDEAKIAFMFRIGYGRPPRSRTSRLPFEAKVTVAAPTDTPS